MAVLYIEGYIGEHDEFLEAMGVESKCFSASDMRAFLSTMDPNDNEIVIEIRSPGGYVDGGFDIYDQLINSGKNITTIAYECASIATVIYLAGSVRKVSKYATPLIHNPWIDACMLGSMDSDKLAALSDRLRVEEDRILDVYVERTGAKREELAEQMKTDASMTSDRFFELGFATEIINGGVLKVGKALAFCKAHKPNIEIMDKKAMEAWMLRMELLFKAATKVTQAIKNMALTLADNTSLYVQTEAADIAVDDPVFTDEAMTIAAEDKTYELSDGRKVTTVAGKITEIVPKEAAAAAEPGEDATALKATVDRLTLELNAANEAKVKAEGEVAKMLASKNDAVKTLNAIKKEYDELKTLMLDPGGNGGGGGEGGEKTAPQSSLETRRQLRTATKGV